ncbi:hypothetical protein BHF71_10760 [Vulcanibacillus modesticaldus]|uniref:Methyltransferase domain-containing protein n=1 Tax=Vulcanibacillus modesticaldus TaxID=337097 RepID=A0A1D2YT32_9BACI|nr:methyltransferase domain-containing protein [Vulcanibacillus modesticaldus]OEF98837.1 hypothetical protein BHF71_10760 [Vulcanibacillus modesticaldus]
MYEKIAKFYDRLGWSKFPLKLWDQMKVYFKKESFNPSSHLDIACGTGVLSIKAASEGIRSEGLDFSIDMINIAKENAKSKNLDITYYHADMRSFNLNKKYALITCTYDAINHLLTIDEWKQTFSRVKAHLNDNGIFIFDCNTPKALKERWNCIHVDKDNEGNYMIQKAIHYEKKGISTASFTVFTKEENGLYDGFEETFTEISFPSSQVIDILREVGFSNITITDTNFNRLDNPDEEYRNVYICK